MDKNRQNDWYGEYPIDYGGSTIPARLCPSKLIQFQYDFHHDHHHGPSFTNKSDPARRFTISVGGHFPWRFMDKISDRKLGWSKHWSICGFLTLLWTSIFLGGLTGFCLMKTAKDQSVIAEGLNEANQVRHWLLRITRSWGYLPFPEVSILWWHVSSRFTYKIKHIGNTFPKHAKSYIVFPSQLTLDPIQKCSIWHNISKLPSEIFSSWSRKKWNIDISS